MILIGISGKKKSGKDTVADILATKLGLSFEKFAFAGPLKQEVAKACGVTVAYIEEHKTHFRPILQWWGTEFRRRLHGENYWIEKWLKQLADTDVNVVFTTDVRFKNEADVIHDAGGFLVRVSRNHTADVMPDLDVHASETELDFYGHFDYQIRNDLSVKSLELCVDDLVLTLKRKGLV